MICFDSPPGGLRGDTIPSFITNPGLTTKDAHACTSKIVYSRLPAQTRAHVCESPIVMFGRDVNVRYKGQL
jgi:hypothetical protein